MSMDWRKIYMNSRDRKFKVFTDDFHVILIIDETPSEQNDQLPDIRA